MIESNKVFKDVRERDVTRAIVGRFAEQFCDYAVSDVVIAGAGPSGLVCGRRLAQAGKKVLIVEQNNYLGGGFWIGGYLMNKVTVREPATEVLDELGVPHERVSEGLHIADGPHACSKLIAAACDAGVKFANMTSVEDVVLDAGDRVSGLVVNWTPVGALPRNVTCADPVAVEAEVVVDATGHDAVVASKLADRGLLEVAGCGAMSVSRSEDAVVRQSGTVYPGLVAIGMSVSALYGLPRMGPTFGAMLLSGQRGAEGVLNELTDMERTASAEATAS
ncbi:MAG: sulfide-dependent adenosine diphosphate thiazole synthase [Phycisphaerae bacterium]